MTSTTEVASPVNLRPLCRPGQSVRVLSDDSLGVVVDVRGSLVELAVWPSRRIVVSRDELAHLTSGDACPRSFARPSSHSPSSAAMSDFHEGVAALLAGNRCRPRARDGRCHWCERELAESHEQAAEVDHG